MDYDRIHVTATSRITHRIPCRWSVEMSSAAGAADSSATEFVLEEFETTVTESAIEDLAERITTIVRDLRSQVVSDDRLEALLWGEPGPDILHGSDLTEYGDPEPFTQREVIEPLFDALGYPDFTTEASGLTDEQRQKADYLFSLREYDDIDSDRLPVEAEPLNKKLDQQKHGIGQVKDWLDTYSFGAEFGIATDGMRWTLIKYDRERYQYDTLAEVNLQPVFIAAFENVTGRQVSLDEWLEESNEELLDGFARSFGFENFRAIASDARSVIKETKSEITDEFYDEYVRRVFGVLDESEDERTEFSLIGDGIDAPAAATGDDVRLFAVELMNRLIFTKFLEDKGLVPETLLADFADTYNPRTYPQSLYETYFEPLFFGVLDTRPSERKSQITNVDFYTDVPYLNGGLFRPTENDERGFTDKDFDVNDAVLESLVRFLESYSFSADGGPEDLDPSVLGNVFEKTINYLTGDAGDQKKSLGAYYTPDEITRFCAEETVQPALLDRFKTVMVEDLGREEVDMERYDDVFAFIERAVPRDANVVEPLLETIDRFRALDPACGSGHFLTSVLGEIVAIRKALYEKHPEDPQTWELRKQTVVENIYGVDIVAPAVEITKLRLWLSIIAEVSPNEVEEYEEDELALPNVVFNVQQGNSLIGYTDLMETTADGEQMRVDAWGSNTVRQKYETLIEQIRLHKQSSSTDTAMDHLNEAEHLLDGYRTDLDSRVLGEFRNLGIEEVTADWITDQQPFHWVLEFAPVYADGGFDVIVGNPPWDVITSDRDEFFSRYDELFRTYGGSKKDRVQEELLQEADIRDDWEMHKRSSDIYSDYFTKGTTYELQSPSSGGQAKNDLSMLFLERVFTLACNDGYIAQILPGKFFTGTAAGDLRTHLLDATSVRSMTSFENKGIFSDLHRQYRFGIVVTENSGRTEQLWGNFMQRDLEVLRNRDALVSIPKDVLTRYSPSVKVFPHIQSSVEVDVIEKIVQHLSIGERWGNSWYVDIYKEELNQTRDKDRFIEDDASGAYPVYGGKQIHQYNYDDSIVADIDPPVFWSVPEEDSDKSAKRRIREKNLRRLKSSLYEIFEGTGSQKQFVNQKLSEARGRKLSPDDVLLDCTEYRIAFREVSNTTNERSFIAAVIPPGIVCHHKLPTVRPYEIAAEESQLRADPLHTVYDRIFDDKEIFAVLGLLNSIPFDYFIRKKLDNTVSMGLVEESQAPRLTEGDDWFEHISSRAARLNCYGEAFAEMRERLGGIDPATDPDERKRLRAEIDAAAFHAYGLDQEETQFILDDFHRVQNPRLMTEDYFDLVSEHYDVLADHDST